MDGSTVSHYTILEKLGEGGLGEVYKARDTRLDRLVALKFLRRGSSAADIDRSQLLREAKAASALNHPNISHIYEIDEADGETFIAMELIEGENLRNRIAAGPIAIRDAVHIALEIAAGLCAAHESGIVHRDIKPENIIITKAGTPKIADFGLALTIGPTAGPEVTSRTGTARYMSPEQIRGDRLTGSTDIWSLGVVLYEMVAGRPPFSAEYDAAVFYSISNERYPSLAGLRGDVPPPLEKIIDRCLEKSPSERFPDVASLMKELERVQASRDDLGKELSNLRSIAVLPFKDISPDKDNKYFSDGLTEEIIASLSKLGRLKVISRTSVMRYDGTEKPLRQIASELGAHYLLEGAVRKHGSDLRITAELIDAAQDASLWAENFRGTMKEVFDIQETVAAQIVKALKLRLTPDEKRILRKRRTKSTEAYQLYLKGRFFWNKRTEEGMKTAIKLFDQAIGKDARFAPAWAGLADAFNLIGEYGHTARRETYAKAKAAVDKALEIDSRLAEAHASLAILVMLNNWNWSAAEKEFRLALRLNPSYATAHHWFAEYLCLQGRFEEAIREISRAVELDPVSPAILKDRGIFLYYARRYDEAVSEGKKTFELDPTFSSAHRLLSLAYQAKGMYEEAIEENRLWGELAGHRTHAAAALAYIDALAGRRREALTAVESIARGETTDGNLLRGIALVYGALGDIDQGMRWLEKAYEMHADALSNIKVDPKADPLRADPRFAALLKKVGLAG